MPSKYLALLFGLATIASACLPKRTPLQELPPSVTPSSGSSIVPNESKSDTSMKLVEKDPFSQYMLIKQSFYLMEEDKALRKALALEESLDLATCDWYILPSLDMGLEITGEDAKNNPIARLINLAGEAILMEAASSAFGYPQNLWRPVISKYENEMIPILVREFDEENAYGYGEEAFGTRQMFNELLVAKLDRYRLASGRNLKEIYVSLDGCGSGGFPLYIKTDPENGVARFIPLFFYHLCRLQNIDPEDPLQCNHWREAVDGTLFGVIGYYRYVVSWPDGSRRVGQLSFDDHEEGETVTLRRR